MDATSSTNKKVKKLASVPVIFEKNNNRAPLQAFLQLNRCLASCSASLVALFPKICIYSIQAQKKNLNHILDDVIIIDITLKLSILHYSIALPNIRN
jgi:hypothetical protein